MPAACARTPAEPRVRFVALAMEIVLVSLAVVVVGVLAFAALIAWLIRRENEQRKLVEDAWRAYAARHHLAWSDASGAWYRRKGYSMTGEVAGVTATFAQFVVSTGKSHVHYTCVAAQLSRSVPERLIVTAKSLFNRLNFAFRGPVVELGSAHGGDALLVRCRSSDFARSKVDDRLRTALLAIPRQVYIECRDRTAKVCWRGSETDPAVLDQAAALLARIAG
jgi:Tfp pilus assembly protein PilV